MKAARIHRFGPPEVIVIDDLPRPAPGEREILVRVAAAGVGPWDAIIREGKSEVSPPPLTLGSDLSGVVEATGSGVAGYQAGDEVYGVTNPQFCGAQAEYAVARANMVAHKPKNLSHTEAASVPVVAVTAWQMLFEYAQVRAGQTVLILGAAGNVGAYALQFAVGSGLHVAATAQARNFQFVQSLGATTVVDYQKEKFEEAIPLVDAIIDTVGGDTLARCFGRIKAGGSLVSSVSAGSLPQRPDVKSIFFYVEVSTERLDLVSKWLDDGKLVTRVGTVLPLENVREAHEALAGAPHKPGKIVLVPSSSERPI